mmetsp:Transcript_5105/g.11343  ORF Transcript_5105/g.11343 Transcript_5105/m.11343 type:complete len:87 (+) Transcript_5105:57-317(+)
MGATTKKDAFKETVVEQSCLASGIHWICMVLEETGVEILERTHVAKIKVHNIPTPRSSGTTNNSQTTDRRTINLNTAQESPRSRIF